MDIRCADLTVIFAAAVTAGVVTSGQHSAPTPARDPTLVHRANATPPRRGTATISGTVVTLSSEQPIADAAVNIYGSTLPDRRLSTTTDVQGRFQFDQLSSGRYTVGAVRADFVNVTYGTRIYGRGGRAIPLAEGEHRNIRLQLPHKSAIAGTVVDERGTPATAASIGVFKYSMAFGYPRALRVGSSTTDDTGAYRLESLEPGDYAVCATTRATTPLNDGQRLQAEIDRQRRSVEFIPGPEGIAAQQQIAPQLAALEARLPPHIEPVVGFAPVCHPGTSSLPSRVRVLPDRDLTGVNLQFPLTRLIRIEGVVNGISGADVQLDPIMLLNSDETRTDWVESARPNTAGQFRFTNVPPGTYRIFVQGKVGGASGVRISAMRDVVAADEDIKGLVLDIQRGATITGQVIFRGTRRQPSAATLANAGFRVRMEPAVGNSQESLHLYPGVAIATPDEDGRFVFPDVFPGDYVVKVMTTNGPLNWFSDAASLAGRDVMNEALSVKANQQISGLVVTMTDQRAEISGTLLTASGEPAPQYLILVYPTDERYWTAQSGRMLGTRPKEDGSFTLSGLRAGRYRIATLLDAESGVWFDPAYLRQIDTTATALSVTDGERKVLNLRAPNDQ
ncbi:MAG TPA: carboxypeptidase-like regulatory domain-containing protein [Vicinamibacterales bacterium]|nr:carboxypeptidase-like regulatory domain-containing protein [Vicinamibacterales bacterium]